MCLLANLSQNLNNFDIGKQMTDVEIIIERKQNLNLTLKFDELENIFI